MRPLARLQLFDSRCPRLRVVPLVARKLLLVLRERLLQRERLAGVTPAMSDRSSTVYSKLSTELTLVLFLARSMALLFSLKVMSLPRSRAFESTLASESGA